MHWRRNMFTAPDISIPSSVKRIFACSFTGCIPVSYTSHSSPNLLQKLGRSRALEVDYGFRPSINIREGLRKFTEWYKEYSGS
mgnify:CR=1 FL=1